MESSKRPNTRRAPRRAPRGQAMLEYSLVSHFILLGGSATMLFWSARLFEGINKFYDSVYTVIETAAL